MSKAPVSATPFTHLKRAFGWNLGKIAISQVESSAFNSAGIIDPTIQRYAAWRRSLLLVAIVPTALAFILAVIDTFESGFGGLTRFGVGLEMAWLVAAAG